MRIEFPFFFRLLQNRFQVAAFLLALFALFVQCFNGFQIVIDRAFVAAIVRRRISIELTERIKWKRWIEWIKQSMRNARS